MAQTLKNGAKGEPTVGDLTAQIENLRADLEQLTSSIGEIGKAKGAALTEAASQKVEEVRSKGQQVGQDVATQAKDAQYQAEAFVKAQPATALGLAAGLGFLVGLMSMRK